MLGPSFLATTTLCNVRDNFIEFTIRARVFCFISDRILLLIVILMGLCDMRSNFKNQLHLKLLPEIIFFRMFTLTSPSSGSRFRPQWLAIDFSSTGKKKNLPLCRKETNATKKHKNLCCMVHIQYLYKSIFPNSH